MMASDDVHRAAISILSYLRAHPDAKDSVEGIARWWVHADRETVEKALQILVKEGAVETHNNVYRLKPK
jgi:hypothetical protein